MKAVLLPSGHSRPPPTSSPTCLLGLPEPAEAAAGDSGQPEPAGGEDTGVAAASGPEAAQRGTEEQQPGGPAAGHGGRAGGQGPPAGAGDRATEHAGERPPAASPQPLPGLPPVSTQAATTSFLAAPHCPEHKPHHIHGFLSPSFNSPSPQGSKLLPAPPPPIPTVVSPSWSKRASRVPAIAFTFQAVGQQLQSHMFSSRTSHDTPSLEPHMHPLAPHWALAAPHHRPGHVPEAQSLPSQPPPPPCPRLLPLSPWVSPNHELLLQGPPSVLCALPGSSHSCPCTPCPTWHTPTGVFPVFCS